MTPPTAQQEFLDSLRNYHSEHEEALRNNPDGGVYYKPHPVMVHSGKYWRCAHGNNAFWTGVCFRCAIKHPVLAYRWYKKD